jgi:glycosyltransferase involved in cell wall biosynthesis
MSLLALRPGRVGGAETYVRKLLAELPRTAEEGDSFVAVMGSDLVERLATPGWERAVVERSGRRIVVDRLLEAFTPWRALEVEEVFRRIGADVVLFPQQSIFPKRVPGRRVLSVGDVQHLFHPENIPLSERLFRRAIYPWSLQHADRIVAISEFSRATLVERCGVPAARIETIPHGYEPPGAEDVTPTDRVAAPYLYYPAATFPHKNHAALIRSYAALRLRGDLDAKLVFTGMQTRAWPRLERLAADLGVGAEVVHLGFLPYAEVRRVFAGAEAIVFPSRYEGFGIPVVEAAVEFRKKVITSRLPVFDEIGVPRERQIDFRAPEALLRALRLEGPTVLEREPITWREVAERTAAAMRAACVRPVALREGRA